jgi:hypothetical protein
MGIQDRDWYREEQRRKRKGEMEFDRRTSKRRWQWPYRFRADLPYWVSEWIRAALYFCALGLLYLAWTHIRP